WILYYKSSHDDIDDGLIAAWLAQLPAAKRAHLQRRLQHDKQLLSLIGWQLLRYGMHQTGQTDFALQQIEFPEHGKPHIPGGWDFNLSHSGRLVACAFSREGRIGIDVEQHRQLVPQRFARYFSAAELAWMGDDSDRFIDLWTRKEAVIKASGIGLKGLRQVVTQADSMAHDSQGQWFLHKLELDSGYHAHVATDCAHSRIQHLQQVPLAQLRGT
ncbi:MAG: 4'-phosphopantetheinyl transferase superfamily protein, partial [Gammaproteobacteria bacterium]